MYAARNRKAYLASKAAKGVQARQFTHFSSDKLSPEEERQREQQLKRESKQKKGAEFRQEAEKLYDGAEAGKQ